MTDDLSTRLVVGLAGTWPTRREAAWITVHRPAGVILFSRNINNCNQLKDLCRVLHELSPGLEIMADHEGGPVSQLAAAVGRPPSAWSLGVLDDPGLTARVHVETGSRLLAVGLDRILAPVADVLTEPRNPVIGVRAFGAEPTMVTRHTVAAVTGLLQSGLRVCLKHWPGHGGTDLDSHLAEADVGQGAVPGPFVAGINAGADGLMVGHLLTTAPDAGDQPRPATLDPAFLVATGRDLARDGGARPLLYADDVTMGALGAAMERLGVAVPEPQESGLYDPAGLPREWFEHLAVGCDRLLIRGIPDLAFPVDPDAVEARTAPEPAAGPPAEWDATIYREVRTRLWALAGPRFVAGDRDLCWVDLSRGDRWQVAGGSPVESVADRLAGMFRQVREPDDLDPAAEPLDRLAVASHRPLPSAMALPDGLAAEGVCLALGHPSLQADLAARLGPNWEVGALYDIAPNDLIGAPGSGGTII